MALIRVINPNSNPEVTQGLADATACLAVPGRIEIETEQLDDGPFGIETQRHVESVAVPLCDRMHAAPADAFVIACYSDPGLALCRTEISSPVFGIQESALAQALTRGHRFGVIAVASVSIPRHLRAIQSMGLMDRLAAERPLDLTVAETTGDGVLDRLVETGKALKELDGADVIVLGCAGMARHRRIVETELSVPVIDPAQAAVSMASSTLLANISSN